MRPKFFYGYVIIALCFANMVVMRGVNGAFGVYYLALLEEFPWSRSAGASIASANFFVYAIAPPLVGLAFDGQGLGALVMVPATQLLVSSIGWRWTYIATGGLLLLILLPANALFQRRTPAEVGQDSVPASMKNFLKKLSVFQRFKDRPYKPLRNTNVLLSAVSKTSGNDNPAYITCSGDLRQISHEITLKD